MSRHTGNTNSSKGQVRTLLTGIFGFMNKPLKSGKDNEKEIRAIKKSKQVAIIRDEYELLEAGSYSVDEISHEDFESYQTPEELAVLNDTKTPEVVKHE